MENLIVWLLISVLVLENTRCVCGGADCKNEPRCKVMMIRGLKTADCYDRKFYSFPKCVVADVEVIELTFNRIRKVTKEDLSRFNYLKYLYLTDNMITVLDNDTFTDMSSLSSLDLSLNGLSSVPASIFHLPSLKTLRLSQNLNINLADAAREAKPITSPLTVLDVSQITDKGRPVEFPDFGPMPLLATLNITGNQYVSLAPRHLAGLCNLQILIKNNVSTEYDEPCDCWVINNWLKERNVQFVPFVCPIKENNCLDRVVSDEDEKMYAKCREMYDQIVMTHRLAKIGTGVGIALLVVAVAICACCWIRRRRRNGKKTKTGNANDINQTDGIVLLSKPSFPANN